MSRRAFTLVEMLVVLALMLVLAVIAIAFVPRIQEKAAASRGASQLQSWLLIARQWAKRDNRPTGIRFQPDAQGFCRDLQYVQQSDPFYVPNSWLATPATTPAGVTYGLKGFITTGTGTATMDFYNSHPRGNQLANGSWDGQPLWAVWPGDFLQLPGGKVYRIADVVPDPTDPAISFTGAPPGSILSLAQTGTVPLSTELGTQTHMDYQAVLRGFRPLMGEKGLQLPQNIAVDTNTNATYNNPLPPQPNGYFDVVFDPDGKLSLGGGWFGARLLSLWVRDVTLINEKDPGDQTLVVVFTRTGMISAFAVDRGVIAASTAPVSPGIGIVIPVVVSPQSTAIEVGDYLVFDVAGNQETVLVEAFTAGGVQVRSLYKSHAANTPLVTDPYDYARKGQGGI